MNQRISALTMCAGMCMCTYTWIHTLFTNFIYLNCESNDCIWRLYILWYTAEKGGGHLVGFCPILHQQCNFYDSLTLTVTLSNKFFSLACSKTEEKEVQITYHPKRMPLLSQHIILWNTTFMSSGQSNSLFLSQNGQNHPCVANFLTTEYKQHFNTEHPKRNNKNN